MKTEYDFSKGERGTLSTVHGPRSPVPRPSSATCSLLTVHRSSYLTVFTAHFFPVYRPPSPVNRPRLQSHRSCTVHRLSPSLQPENPI